MSCDASASDGPKPETLGSILESHRFVRERLQHNDGKLLVWPKTVDGVELVGQPSMAALALNGRIMGLLAAWWCPQQKSPKTPSIDVIRAQARCSFDVLSGLLPNSV